MPANEIQVHSASEKLAKRPASSSAYHGYPEGADVIERFLLMRYGNPRTRRTYGQALRSFARLATGTDEMTPADVRTVTSVHVDAFLQHLENEGRAPATIRRCRATVMKFFKHMVAVGVIDRNPADGEIIRPAPKVNQRASIVWLSRDQANRLVSAAEMTTGVTGTRDRCMVLMLVGCALRRSELVSIDLEHIRQNGEYKELFIPKAKGGARTVLIEPHILEAIERVKVEYGFRSGPLFRSLHRDPRIRGNRMTDKAVYYVIRRISALAGRVISPHALRHTACTLALESGAHIVQAQKFLGHAKPETTMVYEHLISDADTSASKFVNVTG